MDMAHGYLGDGYGAHGDFDPDRGDERDRDRDRGREDWRRSERDRGGMFGGWDRERSRDQWNDRGWRTEGGDFGQRRESFSAHPDDHYRSWRDRHMSELDRDYAEYCREREQQFHNEFDTWRRERRGNPQPLRTGMTQSGLSHDPSGELQLDTEATAPLEPDPVADATLGTNAGDSRGGRGRR
jgi:hypothetical protein